MELHDLVERVRSEFIEMPGLQLTLPQAARLWGLDQNASRRIIDALVEGSFLRWTKRGTVVRADGPATQDSLPIASSSTRPRPGPQPRRAMFRPARLAQASSGIPW